MRMKYRMKAMGISNWSDRSPAVVIFNTCKLSKKNFSLVDTLFSSPKLKWKNLSALSNPCCCPWSLNQARWTSFELFTISLIYLPSIIPLTWMHFPAHGVPLVPSILSFTIFHPAFKLLSEMLQKLTVLFWLHTNSGQVSLSSCKNKTPIASTQMTILGLLQQEECMEKLLMMGLIFFMLKASVLFSNGWITIFFCIPSKYLNHYNKKQSLWNSIITENGGRSQSGSWLWYRGESLPDNMPAKFNEDTLHPLKNYALGPIHSDLDSSYSYCDVDVDNLGNPPRASHSWMLFYF